MGTGLFAADENVYTWADVVRLARLRGEWGDLVADAEARGAAVAEVEARGTPIGDDEVEEAGRAFRYRHDLLAGEDLDDWLRRRGLTVEDWRGFLRRDLAEVGNGSGNRQAAPTIDGESAAWIDGLCSGRLAQLALELADMVAVSPGTTLELLDDAFDTFCKRTAEAASLTSEVEANRLEWTRIDYAMIGLESDSAAREAALCLRTDGESIDAVARRAVVEVEEHLEWLEEVDADLATRFLAAEVDDVVGPVAVGPRFVVAKLRARTPPSTEDEEVCERARTAVVARTVARAVNDRVTWLEHP